MIERFFQVLDRWARNWIDWRYQQLATSDPEFDRFHRVDLSTNGQETKIVIAGNNILKWAAEAGQMLDAAGAENFLEVEMLTTPPNMRPIRLTVQNVAGKSPGQIIAELKARINELEKQ